MTAKDEENSFVCVSCMSPTPTLFEKYSTFIRLTECKNCGKIVDKYVEYDTVLVVIDLLLQYAEAYRHILYNQKITSFLRLATIFLFCGAYDKWIRSRAGEEPLYDLEWKFYRCLVESASEIAVYVLSLLVVEVVINRSAKRFKFVTQSAVAGFYGNVCVVLSIIFRLSNDVSYWILTQLFLFLSHLQVFRALHPSLNYPLTIIIVAIAVGLMNLSSHAIKNALIM